FEQFGIEVFGQGHPSSDLEAIELASVFLKSLGLDSIMLEVNSIGDDASRNKYKTALKEYLSEYGGDLSPDSINRLSTNPLRILDSKAPQDIQILENSPILSDYWSPPSRERFSFITEALSHLGIPFTVNPRLVRGLDYYQDTVFEFKVSSALLGVQQSTILAGGRYDGLVEKMGGPAGVSSIGWAAGLERLSLLLNDRSIPSKPRPVAIIPVPEFESTVNLNVNMNVNVSESDSKASARTFSSAELHSRAMAISSLLREAGIQVEFLHLAGPISTRSQLLKRLAKAGKLNATHAVILGMDEIQKGVVTLKDLDKSEQKHCRVEELIKELRGSL
ncbi:hypothetical protein BX616_007023, partial [Lobosporangium transversale]